MFVSLKESRIENNRCFYSSFYLGPFPSGQSLTIANALRRTLLSECSGLAITSVKIDNVKSEYSTLEGVKDSVLDILLNFKEIVLKKRIKETKTNKIKPPHQFGAYHFHSALPVTGYLKKRGPGVVRAKDLHLPPFIQCVDPDQYIATLAEDGVLNLEFVVMEGKGFATMGKAHRMAEGHSLKSQLMVDNYQNRTLRDSEETKKGTIIHGDSLKNKKRLERQELLTQLKAILKKSNGNINKVALNGNETIDVQSSTKNGGSNSLGSNLSNELPMEIDKMKLTGVIKQLKSGLTLETTNNKQGLKQKKESASPNIGFSSSNSFLDETKKEIFLDSVFSPILKVNYVVEETNNYIVDKNYDNYSFLKNLSQLLDSAILLNNKDRINHIKNLKEPYTEDLLNFVSSLDQRELQYLTNSLQPVSSYQNKKNGVALEIWTNGSIHPKDALLFALKNLSNTFSTLQKGCVFSPIFNEIQSYNV